MDGRRYGRRSAFSHYQIQSAYKEKESTESRVVSHCNFGRDIPGDLIRLLPGCQDAKHGSDYVSYSVRSSNYCPTKMSSYKTSPTSNPSPSTNPPARKHKSMASTFRSFISSAKSTIQGTPTPEERGVPTVDKLFTKVNKEEDGDDCDHDCASCHVKYPRGFKIEEDDDLYGHVKGWSTHILVATGKSDWVRDVADEKGSVMEAIEKKADIKVSNGVCSFLSTVLIE